MNNDKECKHNDLVQIMNTTLSFIERISKEQEIEASIDSGLDMLGLDNLSEDRTIEFRSEYIKKFTRDMFDISAASAALCEIVAMGSTNADDGKKLDKDKFIAMITMAACQLAHKLQEFPVFEDYVSPESRDALIKESEASDKTMIMAVDCNDKTTTVAIQGEILKVAKILNSICSSSDEINIAFNVVKTVDVLRSKNKFLSEPEFLFLEKMASMNEFMAKKLFSIALSQDGPAAKSTADNLRNKFILPAKDLFDNGNISGSLKEMMMAQEFPDNARKDPKNPKDLGMFVGMKTDTIQ